MNEKQAECLRINKMLKKLSPNDHWWIPEICRALGIDSDSDLVEILAAIELTKVEIR